MCQKMSVRRAIRYGTALGILGGTAVLLQHNDWEVSTIGAVRFGRAAYAALRVAVDYKWTLSGLSDDDPDKKAIRSELHRRSALRLRNMCCTNGGAFIKVGQHIGALEYLLPPEYVQTMKVLHSDAPQSPLPDLMHVLHQDLGSKAEMFESIDPEPLGAASLAQVHRARLKDGQEVAVKIQHPKVKAHSFVDIKTMEVLVRGVAWLFPGFQYVWLAEETKKNLPIELDFVHEGHNCERVARLFKDFDFLKVPRIHWDLTSERVLTMDFCEGGKVDDIDYMKKHGISVSEVTRKLGRLYSEMIFVQGYIHCDPHPGNVLVNKTSRGTEIILLDHGLYQTLTDDFRVNYCKLWMAMINADVAGIKRYADALNAGHAFGLLACMLTARSWTAITSGIDKKQFTSDEGEEIRVNAAKYLVEISDILNRVPRQMLLIFKTNDVLRGIEAALNARANATSFLTMSRCCVRAIAHDLRHQCPSWICQLRVLVAERWQLIRLSLYEFYLWLSSSPLWTRVRKTQGPLLYQS